MTSFTLFHISCFSINLFYCTKYFITSLIFLLFRIFSVFYSLTSFTSIGFTSSLFCPSTSFLYQTTWLTFITRWILIKAGSLILTTLVNTTSSMIYKLIYWFTSFLTSFFLNAKFFILNITLSPFFHFSASFLLLSVRIKDSKLYLFSFHFIFLNFELRVRISMTSHVTVTKCHMSHNTVTITCHRRM